MVIEKEVNTTANQTEKDPWELEPGRDPDEIDADNINPEIPRELWDSFLWQAVRAAIDVSNTKEEVIRRVKLWNTHNRPQLPEVSLVRKTLWALKNLDTKFKGT